MRVAVMACEPYSVSAAAHHHGAAHRSERTTIFVQGRANAEYISIKKQHSRMMAATRFKALASPLVCRYAVSLLLCRHTRGPLQAESASIQFDQ